MDTLELIRRADLYRTRRGWASATVSKVLFRDAHRLDQLRIDPDSIRLKTLRQAFTRLEAMERVQQEHEHAA